jgi:hypothetical protein
MRNVVVSALALVIFILSVYFIFSGLIRHF